MTHEEKMRLMIDDKYPLSAKYDPNWIFENKMGGHCLWLVESLTRMMRLAPGMRVLDMGCGNALTSIFLAREFGCTVFATDLWVSATDNFRRIEQAGVAGLVYPIHAEAHALPFADGFFDAVIGVNSFQFFSTDDAYLIDHMAPLLRKGGQMGLALWGPDQEFQGKVPAHFQPHWWPDFYYYHSLNWWKWHIEKTGLFDIEQGDDLDGDGVRVTERWAQIMEKSDGLHTDGTMRWNRIVARRNGLAPQELRM